MSKDKILLAVFRWSEYHILIGINNTWLVIFNTQKSKTLLLTSK